MKAPTVLVVDDVAAIVEELLTLMHLHEISAVGAPDLDQAIATLEREPTVRLISCDIRLDRASGLEIVDRIGEHRWLRGRMFQYLFITGDQMQFDQIHSSQDRAVLSKPVQPALLIETIQRMLVGADA